jgi:hypothetical protein
VVAGVVVAGVVVVAGWVLVLVSDQTQYSGLGRTLIPSALKIPFFSNCVVPMASTRKSTMSSVTPSSFLVIVTGMVVAGIMVVLAVVADVVVIMVVGVIIIVFAAAGDAVVVRLTVRK